MSNARATEKLKGRRPLYPMAGIVLIALVMALAGSSVLGNRLAHAASVTVQVGQKPDGTSGNRYNPATVTVNAGDSLSFIRFAGTHDAVSAVVPSGASPFDSGILAAGVPYVVTPTVPGTYAYFCSIHSDPSEATLANIDANIAAGLMVGKIVVVSPATATAVPATPTSLPPTPTATTPPLVTPTTPPATPTQTTPPSATASPTTPPPTATPTAPATPTPAPTTVPTSPGDIKVIDNAFDPVAVSVPKGTSVRWVNTGNRKHTVTANDGSFDSGLLAKGDAFSRTFATDGSFAYFCDLHPEMVGTINVGAASDGGVTPPATPTPAPPPPPAAPGNVQILDFDYAPRDLAVTVGASVRFQNFGAKKHTVTANDGSFDSGLMATGDAYSHTFDNLGAFQYYCDLHPNMVGSVTVSSSSTSGSAWPAPPGVPQNLLYNDVWDPKTRTYHPVYVTSLTEINSGNSAFWNLIVQGVRTGTITADDLSPNIISFVEGQYARLGGPPTTFYAKRPAPTPAGPRPAPPATPPSSPPGAPTSSNLVEMIDFDYSPRIVLVQTGATVRFVNSGRAKHTATAVDESFDSGLLSKGDAFSHRFDRPGTFNYLCILHPEMVGTVQVADADGAVPSPAPVVPSAPSPTTPPPVSPGDVSILDFDYAPRTVSVNAGASVRFVNTGVAPHTVTALDSSFDSGHMVKGDGYVRRFSTPGTFEYFCIYHPNMTGTVRVLDASGSAPPPLAVRAVPTSAEESASASENAAVATISMVDLAYEPKAMTVKRGTEITWRNTGVAPHTVTAKDGSFDSGIVMRGGVFSRRFDTLGTIVYFCTLHPGMEATLVVSEGNSTGGASATGKGGATAASTPGHSNKNQANAASSSGGSDHTVRNVLIMVLGIVAVTGVVTVPTVVYGLRSSTRRSVS